MKTYSFNYCLTDRHTLCPLYLTVRARNLRKATKAAQRKLHALVRAERAAYWEWQGSTTERMQAVYVPYHFLRGVLYRGCEVKPVSRRERESRLERSRLASTPEACEALAAVLSAPILQAIEATPVLVDLFSAPLPETDAPSIPLVWTTPMAREDWPTARGSLHRDRL